MFPLAKRRGAVEGGGCWADAPPAAKVPLRWMEPYQLDVDIWGVVESRLIGREIG